MDHTEALESNASDRYALNMLSAAEVDAFEEHYFDCATCAEDVRLGMSLMDGGRRLVRETEAAPAAPAPNVVPIDSHPRRKFLAWIPAAAAAALLVVNGGLMMRAPVPMGVADAHASGAWAGPTLAVELTARGPGDPVGITKVHQNEVLNFQIAPDYESVEARMTDRSGKTVLQSEWPAVALDRGGLTVGFGTLSPGAYQLVVTGKKHGSNEIIELGRRQVEVEK